MRLYAIADLHLSGANHKPMHIFGDAWKGHWKKISDDWRSVVTHQDCVLIPGDISWAMKLEQAKVDLDEIASLPGHKVLIRGNHDYWWSSLGKVRAVLGDQTYAIQNDSIEFPDFTVVGSRGWMCPGTSAFTTQDQKLYERETQRLALSLKHAVAHAPKNKPLIAMMHYPPFNEKQASSAFTQLFEEYNVQRVVYGHLHGVEVSQVFEGMLRGVEYTMVACDYLGFRLKRLI